MFRNVTGKADIITNLVCVIFTDTDEDAMDQDLSDNSSDDPFSDSSLFQEEVNSTAEKISVSVPSEVRIEKETVPKV